MGGRHAPEWVVGMLRNGWSTWTGMGGRHAPESANMTVLRLTRLPMCVRLPVKAVMHVSHVNYR